MKLFTTAQIREIDAYTIEHEPISSINLIERVADALYNTIAEQIDCKKKIAIVAGKGNNGSDAIAIAIKLKKRGYDITLYSFDPEKCKPETNHFLKQIETKSTEDFCHVHPMQFDIIIDGLLGSGLSKPVAGIEKEIIETINKSQSLIVSIDLPSGLSGDGIAKENQTIVKADYTYTLEFPKLASMFPENGKYIGEIKIIPIGLHPKAIEKIETFYSFTQKEQINIKKRERFAHKGTCGHILTIAGSFGKMGAAILTSKAGLTIGAGLVTAHIPKCGITILQTAIPEVMVDIDKEENLICEIPSTDRITSICIGPGIGTNPITQNAIISFISKTSIPIVIDADALNCISLQNAINKIPRNAIITPHVKEFERLFGNSNDSLSRLNTQIEYSKKLHIFIVLKGFHTSITTPEGDVFFNSTGNPGMATAGSGDVLTGIIAGLLAQGYSPKNATICGVYIHGLAGDFAAEELTEYCVTATDIIHNLPKAIKFLMAK